MCARLEANVDTAASILKGTGSVGLSLLYWFFGFVISLAGLAVYLELGSYFPSRSGAEVVYLEQAYPRPRYFFPVAFAVQSVLLSFSSSNAIVLSQYIWRMVGRAPEAWEQKGVAIAGYTVAVIRKSIPQCWFGVLNLTHSQWESPAIGSPLCFPTSWAASRSARLSCK